MEPVIKLAAVIPTLGERPELAALISQLVREDVATQVLAIPNENLYAMWNQGAAWAKQRGAEAVAILNDDIRLPGGTISTMYHYLQENKLDCVGVDPRAKFGFAENLKTVEISGHVSKLMTEITGWCFLVKTNSWQQIDEEYKWWWGNGDLFYKIAQAGGRLGQIKGLGIEHANEGTARNHPWTQQAKKHDALRWKQLHRV